MPPIQPMPADGGRAAKLAPMALDAAGKLTPENTADLRRAANNLLASKAMPKHLNTPELIELLWRVCAPLGLDPVLTAKDTWINPKTGALSLFGGAPLAACQKHPDYEGICEWVVDQNNDRITERNFIASRPAGAVCIVRRRGQEPVLGTFSMNDARQACLLGKQGPWSQYPQIMMKMRARSIALKTAFADVLQGVGIMEHDSPTTVLPGVKGRVFNHAPAALNSADEMNAIFGGDDE